MEKGVTSGHFFYFRLRQRRRRERKEGTGERQEWLCFRSLRSCHIHTYKCGRISTSDLRLFVKEKKKIQNLVFVVFLHDV